MSDSSPKSTRQNQLTERKTIAFAKVSSDETMGEASNLSRAAPRTIGRSRITSLWSVYVDAPLSRIRFARQRVDKMARASSRSRIVVADENVKYRTRCFFAHFPWFPAHRRNILQYICEYIAIMRPTYFFPPLFLSLFLPVALFKPVKG